MTVKCSKCEKEIDIGDADRENSFCGYCGASLRDLAETVAHNEREIEKLKWRPKQSD